MTAEPLPAILDRRSQLLTDGLSFKICQGCNDIMRIGDSPILSGGAGGIFRDWIYDLYRETDDPLSNATEPFRWIYKIYEKERRLDRLVNRMLAIESSQQAQIDTLEAQLAEVRCGMAWKITNASKRARRWLQKVGRFGAVKNC